MAKRKKKLLKGIKSIEEQLKIHEEKREEAEEDGNVELVRYYDKEIKNMEEQIEKKQEQLEKA
jgi:hypothetical protein